MKNIILTILFGFLVILSNGERLILKEANAVVLSEGKACFLQIKGEEIFPLIILPLDAVKIIIEYKEQT